jgi:hypothetical protein
MRIFLRRVAQFVPILCLCQPLCAAFAGPRRPTVTPLDAQEAPSDYV